LDRRVCLLKQEMTSKLQVPSTDSAERPGSKHSAAEPPVSPIAKLQVSVLLPVRNEQLNLEAALNSVVWADEIWVVDSNSTDRTCEIAEERGARAVQFAYHGQGPK